MLRYPQPQIPAAGVNHQIHTISVCINLNKVIAAAQGSKAFFRSANIDFFHTKQIIDIQAAVASMALFPDIAAIGNILANKAV